MSELGRLLIFIGVLIAAIGLVLLALPKLNFKGLPGDIYIQKDNFVFFFPIVTSIVLSIVLSIVISLIMSIFRR